MKKTIQSQAGDWRRWTNERKDALAASWENTRVGDKLVFANDAFRVWSIHLPAGQSLPFHKHASPYFWTVLTDGKSRSYYDDGSVVDSEYESGDTKYFADLSEDNCFLHNLENIGKTTLIFTTVEFVRQTSACHSTNKEKDDFQ